MKRTLLGSAITAALTTFSATPALAAPDASISQAANGATITVTASGDRFAGAISSLTYRNTQYVNTADHGREIQSALQLDGLGECLNPTEAGSKADGSGLSSSSVLNSISSSGNVLSTSTKPAYWLAPGENYGKPCSPSTSVSTAQNSTVLSNYTIARSTSFYAGIPNLISAQTTFTVPENRNSANIEALTGYLPSNFNTWLRYDRASRSLVKLTGTSTVQKSTSPVIVAESNGGHAMGVISPGIDGSDPDAYFAYFTFGGSSPTSKWSCVYGKGAIAAGTQLSYNCLMAIGSVDEVMSALNAYPMPGQSVTSMLPVFRFYLNPKHFMTTSYSEAASAGYPFETTGFHLFPSASASNVALYRCRNSSSGAHFVSLQSNCEGKTQEGILGYAASNSASGLVPLYRFFRSSNGDYLITTNYGEGTAGGYAYEGGLGFVAP